MPRYFEIPVTFPVASYEYSMKFINRKRNWNPRTGRHRKPEEQCNLINLKDCKIYWHGKYLILQDWDELIHYWETGPYCYLKQAVEFMQLEKPAAWKTVGALIAFRQAIRETEANGRGYVESMLEGKPMTLQLYKSFMLLTRAHDVEHHGTITF